MLFTPQKAPRIFAAAALLSAAAARAETFCLLPAAAPDALQTASSPSSFTTLSDTTYPLTALPAYSSRPAAAATLYLSFTGDNTPNWGSDSGPYHPNVTPAYDRDYDPSTFSVGELDNIHEIWARVAEKYSIFNLNVTTVDPGNLTDGRTVKVVVGGDGAWLGSLAGGIGYVNSFTSPLLINKAFVFSQNLASRGDPKVVAEAAAHEAGHTFGLQHQSTWTDGVKTQEYSTGDDTGAPIMGKSYYAARGRWWSGSDSIDPNEIQNDRSILGNFINNFGLATAAHGMTMATADPLKLVDGAVADGGLIRTPGDANVFSFHSDGGALHLDVLAARYTSDGTGIASVIGMLDSKAELYAADGTLLASASHVFSESNGTGLDETLALDNLPAGDYFLAVKSQGGYGDVGQFTVQGYVPEPMTAGLLGVGAVAALLLWPGPRRLRGRGSMERGDVV